MLEVKCKYCESKMRFKYLKAGDIDFYVCPACRKKKPEVVEVIDIPEKVEDEAKPEAIMPEVAEEVVVEKPESKIVKKKSKKRSKKK